MCIYALSWLLLPGVIKSYTLECNYNDGPYVNDVRSSAASVASLLSAAGAPH